MQPTLPILNNYIELTLITLTSASQNDPLTGRNCFRDIDIDIPDDATPGNYHLLVYCTDAAGNEAYIAQDLKIQ
ncbi:MAG: DUF4625 domain-containing protein [Paludibacteraceae bacterium]|nr:DUF4625 domain-containing protein [Paludibacteraceae bacterium]